MDLSIVILAAGQGTRMNSSLPKVLHPLAGKPIIQHVVEKAFSLSSNVYLIHGFQGHLIQQNLSDFPIRFVKQEHQLGTGHAVLQALPEIPSHHRVLILYGDCPLISSESLKAFIAQTSASTLGIITARVSNPFGLGRILRNDSGQVYGIIEEKDAEPQQKLINEINSGIFLVPAEYLNQWLPKLNNQNAQKELYLTDIVQLAYQQNIEIKPLELSNSDEILGINDRIQLAGAEKVYRKQLAQRLMAAGVTLTDPDTIYLRGDLEIGQDSLIEPNVIFEGKNIIGKNVYIGAHCILKNVKIEDFAIIHPYTFIESSSVQQYAIVGPYARLRPGCSIAEHAHIGNFIEIKNSQIGQYSKAHHLGYIGDAEIGESVNVGAGTITCNYDGTSKHKTIVRDRAFIGSGTELVAPVVIEQDAYIGAGSTITKDAPEAQLTLARTKQITLSRWKHKKKE